MNNTVVIDGNNAVLGRLASFAAKQALLGKQVVVVNCEHIVLSGQRSTTIESYKALRRKGGHAQRGPYFPTRPAMITKRTVRGMLSHKEGRGGAALKRIRCYEGMPTAFIGSTKEHPGTEHNMKTMTLQDLSEELR